MMPLELELNKYADLYRMVIEDLPADEAARNEYLAKFNEYIPLLIRVRRTGNTHIYGRVAQGRNHLSLISPDITQRWGEDIWPAYPNEALKFSNDALYVRIYNYILTQKLHSSELNIMDRLNEAAANGNKFANNNIVIFLGATDSGKSTTINFLIGHDMQEKPHPKLPDTSVIDVTDDSKARIKEYAKAGHTGDATTLLPERFAEFGVKGKASLIFCDSPGFGENRGVVSNLITSVAIKKVVKSASSIKILVCIDYENIKGKRFSVLRSTLNDLQVLFKEHAKFNESIIYLLTKTKSSRDDVIKMIRAAGNNIAQNPNDRSLIENMLREDGKYIQVCHPIHNGATHYDNRKLILEELRRLKPIPVHSNAFNIPFSSEIKGILKEDLSKIAFEGSKLLSSLAGSLDDEKKHQEDIKKLKKKLKELESSLDDAKKQEAAIRIRREEFERRLTTIRTQITQLKIEIENCRADLIFWSTGSWLGRLPIYFRAAAEINWTAPGVAAGLAGLAGGGLATLSTTFSAALADALAANPVITPILSTGVGMTVIIAYLDKYIADQIIRLEEEIREKEAQLRLLLAAEREVEQELAAVIERQGDLLLQISQLTREITKIKGDIQSLQNQINALQKTNEKLYQQVSDNKSHFNFFLEVMKILDNEISNPAINEFLSKYKEHTFDAYTVFPMLGDGDCLFHTIEHQLRLIGSNHRNLSPLDLRRRAVAYIRNNPQDFVDGVFETADGRVAEREAYLHQMERQGQYANEVEIMALAHDLGLRIVVVQPSREGAQTMAVHGAQNNPTIYVAYNGINHYDSIRPKEENNALQQQAAIHMQPAQEATNYDSRVLQLHTKKRKHSELQEGNVSSEQLSDNETSSSRASFTQ